LFADDITYSMLRGIDVASMFTEKTLENFCNDARAARRASRVATFLVSDGLAVQHATGFYATKLFSRSLLLIDALEGADLDKTFASLASLYPELDKISVVKSDMTNQFLNALFQQPSIGRIHICSPWIHLTQHQRQRLRALVVDSLSRNEQPQITVITRRPDPTMPSNKPLQDTLDFLREIGADVIFAKDIHAKLYIRTPPESGGDEIAVIGSQNLTIPKYIELGLLVRNDSRLVGRLEAAFFEMAGRR
jgi:hypothetical protein